MGLDLSTFVEEYWDLKLPDKAKLQIKKPSQKLLLRMVALGSNPVFKNGDFGDDPEGALNLVHQMVASILSNNSDSKNFDVNYIIENINLDMMLAIITGYMEFGDKVKSNPN